MTKIKSILLIALSILLSNSQTFSQTLLDSITILSETGSLIIPNPNGTLQLSTKAYPEDATDKTVFWTIENGLEFAIISTDGLVTGLKKGISLVKATANDDSKVFNTIEIEIREQKILVSSIGIQGENGSNEITSSGGTLQMTAIVSPTDAADTSVSWSVKNEDGLASISKEGLLKAIKNGTVWVKVTANDSSGVSDSLQITISGQIPLNSLTIDTQDGTREITTPKGTLQMIAQIDPLDATDTSITWSIENISGKATISKNGLIEAADDGEVRIKAIANDGSELFDTLTIIISGQKISVSSITVEGDNGNTTISITGGTLQMIAKILPTNSSDTSVTWSVENQTGKAAITNSGLLTAIENGTVLVKATANDVSNISGTIQITISNQKNLVNSIVVKGTNGATGITVHNGTLQMLATILPSNANDTSITWSVTNETGAASISSSGILTALANGTVRVKAMANDASGVFGTRQIKISKQMIFVNSITIKGANDVNTIKIKGGTLQMSALVEPLDASNNTVSWSLENKTGMASISNTGLLTALENGTVIVKATSNDGLGISSSMTVTISGQPTVGIKRYTNSYTLDIYPNPTTSDINFKTDINYKKILVSNVFGQTVIETPKTDNISLTSLSAGVYIVFLLDENGSVLSSKKIVKE